MSNENYDFTNIGYNTDKYYARDSKVYLIKGSHTYPTNLWTGSLPDGVESYDDGLTIDYFLPQNVNGSEISLNLSEKGFRPVYIGTTPVTTHFPRYSVIRLTYVVDSALNNNNGCWEVVSAVLDTDSKVTQIPSTSNNSYEILFSNSAGDIEETATVKKTSSLTYNPYSKDLLIDGTVNGIELASDNNILTITNSNNDNVLTVDDSYNLGEACTKDVTDNKVPTDISSADKNLITGRTLYYAGYTKNNGTVTGTGNSGYIAKWESETGITNGPQLGNDQTTFLRNDGTWQVPGISEIPVATADELGGIKVGKENNTTVLGVKLDIDNRAYVDFLQNNASNSGYVAKADTDHRVWGREGNSVGWQDPNHLYLIYEGTAGSATGEDADLVNSLVNLGWTDCII